MIMSGFAKLLRKRLRLLRSPRAIAAASLIGLAMTATADYFARLSYSASDPMPQFSSPYTKSGIAVSDSGFSLQGPVFRNFNYTSAFLSYDKWTPGPTVPVEYITRADATSRFGMRLLRDSKPLYIYKGVTDAAFCATSFGFPMRTSVADTSVNAAITSTSLPARDMAFLIADQTWPPPGVVVVGVPGMPACSQHRVWILPLGILANSIVYAPVGLPILILLAAVRDYYLLARGQCPTCRYSSVGLAGPVCPECGYQYA